MMDYWILLALLSALFAGLTSILAKIGIKDVNSNLATAIRTIVVLIMAWAIVSMTGSIEAITDISGRTLLFLILSGLATGASWLCFFRAIQIGDVNKVTPVDKSSTLLTIILAFIFLGERFTSITVVAMVLMFGGTMLMIEKKDVNETKDIHNSWLFAVLSAVFAALTSILGKIGIEDVDSNLGTAIRTVVVLIMAWLIVFIQGAQKQISSIGRRNGLFLILSGLATGASWLCFYRALQDGPASVVVPIDKLSVLFTVLFAVIVLKEKMTTRAYVGLILLVVGTTIMAL